MNREQQQQIREDAAMVLEAIAAEPTWDGYLMFQLEELVGRVDDELLAYALEEMNHYSGVFDARNILLIRVKPDKAIVSQYKREFEEIADALRAGMTWDEYRRAGRVRAWGNLRKAVRAPLARLKAAFTLR